VFSFIKHRFVKITIQIGTPRKHSNEIAGRDWKLERKKEKKPFPPLSFSFYGDEEIPNFNISRRFTLASHMRGSDSATFSRSNRFALKRQSFFMIRFVLFNFGL